MCAVFLLVLVTTAQLLLGSHAAYMERPNWEDNSMSYTQEDGYGGYHSSDTRKYQDDTQGQYLPFDVESELLRENTEADNGYSIATTEVETCTETINSQIKVLMEMKKNCTSGFDDCCQIKNLVGRTSSGIYDFNRFCNVPCEPFSSVGTHYVLHGYCDMESDNGGWLVVQKRIPKGTLNFARSWDEYETGFGDINGEFWYGLRNLHCLTSREDVELRIDMVSKTGTHYTTTFDTFKVAGAGDKYKLTVGGGKGAFFDTLIYHNGQYFSTFDQDNDKLPKNCAVTEKGGWWFNNCYGMYLNGDRSRLGVYSHVEAVSTEMKVRPKKCLI